MTLKYILISLLTIYYSLFTLSGCGYKPSSHYAKNEISGKVYVDVTIDIENAQNSVLIKDMMNEMIINQFEAELIAIKSEANSFMKVHLSNVSHTALTTDLATAFAKTYRTTVDVTVSYHKKETQTKKITVSNYYDYNVENESTVSDEKKQEAVKVASKKALDDILSKIAIGSFKKQ